jgi:translation initiation factor IF-3
MGVMPLAEALMAAASKNLDLIEISPTANPPVARIMSYDKFRYQEEKKRKKQRIAQKNLAIKRIQLSGRTATNDLMVKARLLNKFMAAGHPINIVLTLRGREKGNQEYAHEQLKKFLAMLAPHRVVAPAKFMGRGIQTQITPTR